jgi:hypothetical protein
MMCYSFFAQNAGFKSSFVECSANCATAAGLLSQLSSLQVELDSSPGGFELEKDNGNILTVAHGTNVSFFNANK